MFTFGSKYTFLGTTLFPVVIFLLAAAVADYRYPLIPYYTMDGPGVTYSFSVSMPGSSAITYECGLSSPLTKPVYSDNY